MIQIYLTSKVKKKDIYLLFSVMWIYLYIYMDMFIVHGTWQKLLVDYFLYLALNILLCKEISSNQCDSKKALA